MDDNYVYVAGKEKLRIYNKQSGELIWEKYNSPLSFGAVVVDDECFYTFSNDTVFAYNKESRDVKWIYIRPGVIIQMSSQNTFAITDEILLFTIRSNSEGNGQVVALNIITGEYLWERSFIGEWVNTPVIANGIAYIIPSSEVCVYGYALNTGEQLFYDKTYNYQQQPIVADHKLFIAATRQIVVFENVATAIGTDKVRMMDGFELLQNYPNPFNPSTLITFKLPCKERISLKIYNNLGEEIYQLIDEEKPAGSYTIEFDGSKLSSGIYFYKLVAGSFTSTKKLLLIR